MSDATKVLSLLAMAEEAAHSCIEAAHEGGVKLGCKAFYDTEAVERENAIFDRMQKAFVDLRAALEVQS